MKSKQIIMITIVVIIILGLTATLYMLRNKSNTGAHTMLVDKNMEKLVSNKPMTIKVSVNAVGNDGWFKKEYTCDGQDKTPTINITGIPENASAIVLIMYDPDAPIGTFIHWLAITENTKDKTITIPTSNMIEGKNDFRRIGYGGPCPPRGHGPHRYYFLILALDYKPNLKQGFTLKDLLKASQGHVITWGYTMGRYER